MQSSLISLLFNIRKKMEIEWEDDIQPTFAVNCTISIARKGGRHARAPGYLLLSVRIRALRIWSNSQFFYPRFYPLHLFSYLNSWERAIISPFECSVLNKGTTGTIFITSLVWRGPWLGIEPGTSRTRSQHSTTRLSRRR